MTIDLFELSCDVVIERINGHGPSHSDEQGIAGDQWCIWWSQVVDGFGQQDVRGVDAMLRMRDLLEFSRNGAVVICVAYWKGRRISVGNSQLPRAATDA